MLVLVGPSGVSWCWSEWGHKDGLVLVSVGTLEVGLCWFQWGHEGRISVGYGGDIKGGFVLVVERLTRLVLLWWRRQG